MLSSPPRKGFLCLMAFRSSKDLSPWRMRDRGESKPLLNALQKFLGVVRPRAEFQALAVV